MPDPFLDPIFERMAREQRAGMRIGTLTAIDTGDASVTVSLAGDEVPGVRWVGSYTPTVGDMVVVSRVEAMWVVLGKLSKQLAASTVIYGTTVAYPSSQWGWTSGGGWVTASELTQSGSGGVNSKAGIARFISPAIPGATILSAKVGVARKNPDDGDTLATPVIYGISAGTSPITAPTVDPSVYAASAVTAGYGPWRPGALWMGQSAYWDLPSAWLTALLAGSVDGLMIYTTATAGEMTLTNETSLVINYSIPA